MSAPSAARRPAPGRLVAAAALALSALAQEGIASRGPTLRWAEISSLMSGMMVADVDDDGRRILLLAPTAPAGAAAEQESAPAAAAREALEAARNHVAWAASGILTSTMAPPAPGDSLPSAIPAPSLDALFGDPAFAEPLRRFAAATLGARGLTCADCLEGLRPSRDIDWASLRAYLGAFIHVRSIDEEGRIDLRVGTLSSSLPPFGECDRDLAAAAHALMREAVLGDPALQQIIAQALAAGLRELEAFPTQVLRSKLDESVPAMVLSEPAALRPLLERAPSHLDLHGLRCAECASRVPLR